MGTALSQKDFRENTTLRTPLEQMRANSMVSANHDKRGMSIISFNINAFLEPSKQDDALFILGRWAINPIQKNPTRFQNHPTEGKKALEGRAKTLINNLSTRKDMPVYFLEKLQTHMQVEIESEINLLCAMQQKSA